MDNNYTSITIRNCPLMFQSSTDSYLKGIKAIKCYFPITFLGDGKL